MGQMLDGEMLAADPFVGSLLARCGFPPPGRAVQCAVSGGADSTALLALAVAAGCPSTAVHVDHCLRPGSGEDAAVVAATAARLGATLDCHRVEVAPGPNLEARARAARHGVLPPGCLLGHTADDQAETVLGNLMRGAGVEGLAGMAPDARRPLLGLRRSETQALCNHLGLEIVEDPTNLDPRFRRNRIRNEVIPLLGDVAGRDVVPLLVRTAGLARQVTDHLRHEAEVLDPTDAHQLAAAPPAVAQVAVRQWLRRAAGPGGDQHPPDEAAVARVLAVAHGQALATEVAGGLRVSRSGGRLRVEGSGSH